MVWKKANLQYIYVLKNNIQNKTIPYKLIFKKNRLPNKECEKNMHRQFMEEEIQIANNPMHETVGSYLIDCKQNKFSDSDHLNNQ